MTAACPGPVQAGRRLVILAVLTAAACGAGDPAGAGPGDLRTAPLDVTYATGGTDAIGGDAVGDPGGAAMADGAVGEATDLPAGGTEGSGPDGALPSEDAADPNDGGADLSACAGTTDWMCLDAARARRCAQGRWEDRACSDAEYCESGLCMPVCPAGTANCSHDPADGCNVDTTSNPDHCGTCATDCGEAACVDSACVCASVSQAATKSPLDMLVMMDQSSSMDEATGSGDTRWEAVATALRAFVSDAGSDGIGVGIQYFPIMTGGFLFESESCKVADYAKAETPILPLPGNAPALVASLKAHDPYGNTPTGPALKGALQFAAAHAAANPARTVVVVLATDGEPTVCTPRDIGAIAKVAQTSAAATPAVRTFVVGVGTQLTSLDQIAASGGSQKAFLVDQGGNVVQQFAEALKAIQGQALGCSYVLPDPADGQALDHGKVNVQVTPGGAAPQQLAYADAAATCDPAGGWYYDDPAKPNRILLCPATCTSVTADPLAKVDILLGCRRGGEPPDTH